MGSYLQTYLGPYFTLPRKVIQKTEEFKSCSNKDCSNYKEKYLDNDFCSICGSKFELVERQDNCYYDLWYLEEDFPDLDITGNIFLIDNNGIVISNNMAHQIKVVLEGDVGFERFDFVAIKQLFIDYNKDILDAIELKMGAIEIKFGIITYYN